jgi:hypothetical protein
VTANCLLADPSSLPLARLALKSQVLGVATGRGRPFDACALGLEELTVRCVRQMRDDRVLRLQQIGAGRVELFGPEVSAAAGLDARCLGSLPRYRRNAISNP